VANYFGLILTKIRIILKLLVKSFQADGEKILTKSLATGTWSEADGRM
jgi:hypothetical protein